MNDDRESRGPGAAESRRLHPREEVRLAAVLSAVDVEGVPVLIHNVSRDGMLIVFAERSDPLTFSVGKRIRLAVASERGEDRDEMTLDAQIRWVFAYGVGVKVAENAAATMAELRDAAAARLKGIRPGREL